MTNKTKYDPLENARLLANDLLMVPSGEQYLGPMQSIIAQALMDIIQYLKERDHGTV